MPQPQASRSDITGYMRRFLCRLLLVGLCTLFTSCETVKIPNGIVIRPKQAPDGTPWFLLSDQKKMEAALATNRFDEAEEYLKKGADPNYSLNQRPAIYTFARAGRTTETALLAKYGASQAEASAGENQRKSELAESQRLAAQRKTSGNQGYSFAEQFVANVVNGFANTGGSSASSTSSSSNTATSNASRQYEDCRVTYDQGKGTARSGGSNTISFTGSHGSWTVTYNFDSSDHQMSGAGNLEGKYINVRFNNNRPASLKSPYGSGYCTVRSASRQ